MGKQTLAESLAEYDKIVNANTEVPEAGAGYYLKRGALQGISALADVIPNIYNLAKAGVGYLGNPDQQPSRIMGEPNKGIEELRKNRASYMPSVGDANPIAKFLLENTTTNVGGKEQNYLDRVTPAPYLGRFGAATLEGAGAGLAQGPMGITKAAPIELLKQVGTQEAKNATLGALAGGGSDLGGQATGDSVIGQLAGGILAGVVAPATFIGKGGLTVGGIRAGIQTAKDMQLQNAISGKVEPAFSNYVGSTLKGAASGTPNAADNITEGLRLSNQIQGFNPSVAEMAGAPGLIDIQKKFALLNPRNLNAEVSRTEANAKAIQDFYRRKIPAADNPSSVRSSINQSLADYDKTLGVQAKGVANKLPVADQVAIGDVLSSAAQVEKSAARPAITAAYEKAYSLAPESGIDAKPVLSQIEEALGVPLAKIKPETAPNTFNAIKRFLGGDNSKSPEELALLSATLGGNIENAGTKATMTLREAADLRKAVNADAALAARSSDPLATTRLRNIGNVKSSIDEAIRSSPIAQEAKDAFYAANNKYATEYAPRFNEGTNQRVFKDTSLNEPRILPEKFVSEYFKSDAMAGNTRAQQFGKLFGANQEAKDAAKTGILDIYRQKVVDPTTGQIKMAAHDAFMRDYGRTLDSFKGIGVNAVTDIKNIGKEAAKVSATMDDFNSLAKTLKFDTVDALANDALKSPKTMGNVLSRIDADKRSILNTILLDKAFESGTSSGMSKFLSDNQKTLSMTVPKEHLTAMQDIAKALEMTERAPIRGNIAAGGADMLKNATGTSTATVFSQIRAVTGGRSSVEWAAINLAMPALNKLTQTSFANVMENALHSKESAIALRNYLLSTNPEQANRTAQQLLNSMKSTGKLLWASKGPITKNFLGPDKYPENMGRAGTAISTQLDQNKNNQ